MSSKRKRIKLEGNAIVTNTVRDCSNDPYVLKKAEESKKIMEKYGFPKEILDRIRKSRQ
jgi:hypothetical protein